VLEEDVDDRSVVGVLVIAELPSLVPKENVFNGLVIVESAGKLVSDPNWNGIDSALAEAVNIANASIIMATVNPFIIRTLLNYCQICGTNVYASVPVGLGSKVSPSVPSGLFHGFESSDGLFHGFESSEEPRDDGVSKLRDGKLEKLLLMPNDGIDVKRLGVDSIEVSGVTPWGTGTIADTGLLFGSSHVALTILPVFKSTVICK
jgi:hypothetical protein